MSDVRDLVAAFLAEHPDAGANETVRGLLEAKTGRNRTAVLAAWRELTGRDVVSVGSALATAGNRYPSRPGGSFGVEGVRWNPTSLDLPADLPFEDYEQIGWALGRTTDMCRWAFGDWLNYGETAYGEKYAQAVAATGRRPQTLMNYASVARRIARPRRREKLSWSVHAEVASLDPDEQDTWLAEAETHQWTVDELRGMLREPNLPTSVEVVPARDADEAAFVGMLRDLRAEYGEARITVQLARQEIERAIVRQDMAAQLPPAPAVTPAFPDRLYRTLVIDPPWPVEKVSSVRNRRQGAHLDYPVMQLDGIASLPISDLLDPAGAHVFLWTIQRFLPDAFGLFDRWDVRYRCLFTWVKNSAPVIFNSPRRNSEHVLFGTYGRGLRLTMDATRVDVAFTAPNRGHSVKPHEFYDAVASMTHEPRLDMFARQARQGYDGWGNEAVTEADLEPTASVKAGS